ncbi:sucrose-6-phosphate hydrolase SacC (GH32 family) [Streptomyces sp. V4I23]|uniref:glycoside hydrolase family 32 protein n=1 Tax=Streptomyces sp. V4I23 TaxID=3042282 RepID=UPI0027829D7D|nr:glycoside hydrolase family 32 protein [Streptomyces sp. V4I23]MDQ1007792.1 sucrose-6-phosphate hydrolase SacC (GH32 family) [Streptomyces sp. V4I23]
MPNPSRRTVLQALTTAAVVGATTRIPTAAAAPSQRAVYHLTPPSGWLCDPQRPIHTGGSYHLYYLHSAENNAPGWWQHATTTDNVAFTDQGVGIPMGTDFPVWTGSGVVDTANTAGFGAGAVVVLATQPTGGDRYDQEQYLYHSTDGGFTFTAYGPPVISNPDHNDWFRDPKIHWDSARNEWVAVIGRWQSMWFYTSNNLINWTYKSSFGYTTPNIGGMECPDLFEMTADDGTSHWVLAASTQGDYSGLPDTYAYWTGTWNGTSFTTGGTDPQWLDWGWDWYAAVTWPNAASPTTSRFAIAWMNNWHYAARTVPTDLSDGYNGQMSAVRELGLARQPGGWYSLLSQPVPALRNRVTRTVDLDSVTTTGSVDLPYRGSSYELELDISWEQLNNVGLSVGKSADGTRHTNIGVFQGSVYVDRGPSDRAGYTFGAYTQSNAPIDPAARLVHLKVLVDKQSVEVFVNAGHTVLSHQVYFETGDTGISVYADGGAATFSNITVRELG